MALISKSNTIAQAVAAALTTACLLGTTTTHAADSDKMNTLPAADGGECYAKVNVPAVYKTEAISTLVKQASEKIEVVPAKFVESSERVLLKAASTKLIPVKPVYAEIEDKVEVMPASRTWVRGGLKSTIPASRGVLADLGDSGVDLDSVEPGSCFYEFHKEAQYDETQERVMVAQATEELLVVPAKFEKSRKQVMIRPATKKLTAVAAEYETVLERVLIEPAHKAWKKGRGPIERIDNSTGEIMCLINVPAQFEEIRQEVVKTAAKTESNMVPASFKSVEIESLAADSTESRIVVPAKYETFTRSKKVADAKLSWLKTAKANKAEHGVATGNIVCHREIPAKYESYKRKVVKTPGSFRSVAVPAEYTTIKVQKLETAASEKRIPVPEVKEELLKRVKVSDARLEWRPVLCETNLTRKVVSEIQRSLNTKGYQAGAVDGVLGRGTMDALEKFQEDENLAQGGLTYPTIKALGVKL